MILSVLEENPQHLITSLAVLSITYLLFTFIVYPLYFHPLSKIPGPKICALSKYFILYKSWNEQRNRYVQELHENYGSIVRIGPNEIDIADADYLKDIYINDFDKTSFYTQFVNYDSPNTFSTTDKKTHKESRKASHKFYSKSSICSENIQSKITKVMTRTLEVVDNNKLKPIDVFILFSEMAMDTVTAFSFGSNNYISLLNDPFKSDRTIIDDFLKQSSAWFFTTSLPEWYEFFVSKSTLQSSKRCYDWIEKQFNNSLRVIDETKQKNEETLLTVLLDCTKNSIFTKLRAKSEFFDHIAAGHNTTATTLSYLFLRLAENPEIQDRLKAELFEFNDNKNLSSSNYAPALHCRVDKVEELPYMHAVINETFRLHAAIPGQEPRIVPLKGMQWRGSKEAPECRIPGGVTVTMQPWSLHRVETVFPNHEKFDPDRWLDSDELELKAMRKHMMHFGSGARMCIGMHLATAEIKVIVASIMSRYKVSLVDSWDYAHDGEMLDIYTTTPRSESMMLLFTES